jgi:hypothetical protein
MAVGPPQAIPFPISTAPGKRPQESGGRLINCYAEPLGEAGPSKFIRRRSAGLSQHAATANSGYRGGLIVNNLSFEAWAANASTVDVNGNVISIGDFPGTKPISIARNQGASPDVVAVDVDNGAYILASAAVENATATATVGGTTFTSGDVVNLIFLNEYIDAFPVTISHTLGAGETAATVATALNVAINANAVLGAAYLTATVAGAVISISQQGSIGNTTSMTYSTSGSLGETIVFAPASANLVGGAGTVGAFSGVPTLYNGQGQLAQPNSVCFQDGYFFFTIATGQVYSTPINGLTMNALTYITVEAKADVTLLRGVAFSGFLLLFTTGSCEVWQDAANAAPLFPYGRIAVLEFGLAQSSAICGFETGFSELLWVAQDFSVYWMTSGTLSAMKVSPPDLDRLIEAEIRAGNILSASCYVTAGKKFWCISSADWSWELNLSTKKWNERQSLASTGDFGRWRAVCGHPAFGKWLVGDTLTGNLLFVDESNYTENGATQLCRIESGPVRDFPNQIRIARADFDMDVGVGIAVGDFTMAVTGAASGTNGVIRLAVDFTSQVTNNDVCEVSGVLGTIEANRAWTVTLIDETHIELQDSVFKNAYTGGGSAVDLTSPPQAVSPSVAISLSKDGGNNWGNPLIRQIGQQANSLRQRVSVKSMGLSGPMGDRWRIDMSDPVDFGFYGGTQSSDPRSVGS